MVELTPMEKKFVDEYTSILSATQAAIRAGYTTDIDTARKIGTENLSKPHIQQAIKEAAREKRKKNALYEIN